ncbi:flagellar basal-body MS-ring/collar protein FliF [Parvularcula lutaonensis]|uniref:Flagellar M-ring protein n=1 Tax=Parvularcula lutaonensis TaxID=491923 RepID=A0ABV7MG66_9PROT|nr:flagellar basal-body MS-ring/collar protein FliF [Parvularcula lutaonensis]GGY51584.1 flagellar M-ring protein FliF [Parvularcula lutaonensis]
MDTLLERFKGWTLRQRIIAIAGASVALVLVAVMVRMVSKPDMALLYAGLDDAAAGDIVAALDAAGTNYDVRNGSIYVPAKDRDRLRLTLAQQSLPAPANEGYELLDSLDGFSTTSEMFSATYWRAKEGEIARTLMTIPGVKAARVHIGTPQRGAFGRRDDNRTASVTLTAPGGLSDGQVRAIRYLTALAVPKLAASDVAVIDVARGLLTTDDAEVASGSDRRADELERSLLALLEARVGPGNARVSVAMDIIRRREEIEERAYDPDSAVVTARSREEARSTDENRNGPVTVASDLPEDVVEPETKASVDQELREEVAFAVSSTDRRIELMPGGIERLSVAVLINQPVDENGEPLPRSAEEVDALRALVEAAAGINEQRGDTLTVRSLPFEAPVLDEPVEAPGMLAQLPVSRMVEIGAASLTLLAFGLFVLKPIMTKPGGSASAEIIAGELDFERPSSAEQDPLLLLRSRSAERPDAAATLLNAWLDDKEEAA